MSRRSRDPWFHILSSERQHGLTIGCTISELYGDGKSDFREVHVLYSLPL